MERVFDMAPQFGVSLRPSMFFDRLFDEWFRPAYDAEEWVPVSDIAESDKSYILTMELPGVDPKNVDISFDEGVVTIKGEKHKETAEGERCYCSERFSGSFRRSIRVPGKVDQDKIDASFQHGVLKLTLPKSEATIPKRIEIH